MRLSSRTVLLVIAPLASAVAPRVLVREAQGKELRNVLRPASLLAAECICKPKAAQERETIAAALQRELSSKLSRTQSKSSLFIAEDEEAGDVIGACAIEITELTATALGEERAGSGLELRPLLSNLAVSPEYRKRGVAKRLCARAEAAARSWGYDEVLLRVEIDNSRARAFYRGGGYRAVAVDREAERPVAGSGGLRFVPTTQVVMRKDLRYPPLDTVAIAVAALGGAVVYRDDLAAAAALVADGQASVLLERALQLLT